MTSISKTLLLLCAAAGSLPAAAEALYGSALADFMEAVRRGEVCFNIAVYPPAPAVPEFVDQRCLDRIVRDGGPRSKMEVLFVTFHPTQHKIDVRGANAWKLRTPNLSGAWRAQQASASIAQTAEAVTILDEKGKASRGYFLSNDTVVVPAEAAEAKRATVQRGGEVLQWEGREWVRDRQALADGKPPRKEP
jgi:hypothetical protein